MNGKRVGFWLVQWGVLFVCWFLFTDKISSYEAPVGVAAAALAATGAELVRGVNLASFRPRLRWFVYAWRVPGMVLSDCWALAKVLFLRLLGRNIHGEVKAIPFDPGGDDPRSAARRALVTILTTFSPNFIVIAFDRKQRLMLYHQVLGAGVPDVIKTLGAQE